MVSALALTSGCWWRKAEPPRYSPARPSQTYQRPPSTAPAPVNPPLAPVPSQPAPPPAPVLPPVPVVVDPPISNVQVPPPSLNATWAGGLSTKVDDAKLTVWFVPTPSDEASSARVYWTFTGEQGAGFRFAGVGSDGKIKVIDWTSTGSSGYTDANRRQLEQVSFWTVKARRN